MTWDDLPADLPDDSILDDSTDIDINDFGLPLDDGSDSASVLDNDDDWNHNTNPLVRFEESDDVDFLYAEDEMSDLIWSHDSSQSDSLEVCFTRPDAFMQL